VTTLDPSNVQWNPVNSDNYAQISHYLLFEDFADTDLVTNGPFELDQKDSQIILTTLMEDSPYASNINFGEYAFNFLSDNNARHRARGGDSRRGGRAADDGDPDRRDGHVLPRIAGPVRRPG